MARPKKIVEEAIETALVAPESSNLSELIASSKAQKKDRLNPPKFKEMKGKDFSGLDMQEFLNTDLVRNYDFSHCNLDGADFSGMSLQGSKFAGASMDGTIFLECDLRWSSFQGADTSKAIFYLLDEFGNKQRQADVREVQS